MILDLILNNLSKFSDTLIKIDEKLGFAKFRKYFYLGLLLIVFLNITSIARGIIEFVDEVSSDIHSNKMRLRDEYMTDLGPILTEFRASTQADRILYFEFHNSIENLEGVPFKFFDLVLANSAYSVSEVPGATYKNINASMYINLFNKIKEDQLVYCGGIYDERFKRLYPGVHELFYESDHSVQQIIINIPGVKQPMGFIVLEWMDSETDVVANKEMISKKISGFIPRINALILAKKIR